MNNTDVIYWLSHAIRSRVTSFVCTVAALSLLCNSVATKNQGVSVLSLTGALSLAAVANAQSRTRSEAEDAWNDFRSTSNIRRQRQHLFGESTPKALKSADVSDFPWFDFNRIGDERDKFPNVIILGEPGSGKSSLAEYLGVMLKSSQRYAIQPHAKPSDFIGFDGVLGGGRNYGTPDDTPVAWADIASGKVRPSIAQVFASLLELMNERYESYYTGVDKFSDVDVYIDELPSIVQNLGKKYVSSILPQLLMECRKVKIRLWLLVQGSQVRFIGLEGMSDLREGITFVRLGKLATAHAKRLNNATLEVISQHRFPCIVDETPAKLPGYVEMRAAISAFAKGRSETTEESANVKMVEQTAAHETIEAEFAEVEHESAVERLVLNTPDGQQRFALADVLAEVDTLLQAKEYKGVAQMCEWSANDKRLLYHVGVQMVTKLAQPMTSVIQNAWGMQGRHFELGKTLYYEMQLNTLEKAKVW